MGIIKMYLKRFLPEQEVCFIFSTPLKHAVHEQGKLLSLNILNTILYNYPKKSNYFFCKNIHLSPLLIIKKDSKYQIY